MNSKIQYKASVVNDLKLLTNPEKAKLLRKLEQFVNEDSGGGHLIKMISDNLFGLRLDANWRAVYLKTAEGILVLRIAHRKEIYR